MFGILICRQIFDKKKLLLKQRDVLTGTTDHKFIILLDDKDITKMIHYKLKNDMKKIDDLLTVKLDELL
jgi:hypothetical protein